MTDERAAPERAVGAACREHAAEESETGEFRHAPIERSDSRRLTWRDRHTWYVNGVHVAFPLIALALVACDRSTPPNKSAPVTPPNQPLDAQTAARSHAAPAPAKPGTCTLAPFVHKRPMPERLVAVADLHGDLAATRSALRTARVIDDTDRWIGGTTVVVQTGDILDRGDDEQAVLDLIAKLEGEARAAGGDFIMLLGNHELMNAAGDFRYVTPGAMSDFDDVPGLDTAKWSMIPEPARKRFAALAPGGVYAKKLAQRGVVVIVGDTVFSHAGVYGDWATQLETVNQTSRCWLDGQAGGPQDPPPTLVTQDSPVWTRAYGSPEPDCAAARTALGALGASRMVVGHTVQKTINPACDGALWRIDVGLAKLYGGPIEVLEIVAGKPPKVLTGQR